MSLTGFHPCGSSQDPLCLGDGEGVKDSDLERVAVYAALGCSTMHMSVWRGGLVDPGSRSWKYVIL